ncbi:ArpU family phage packaging/lysis transcriptional regulator [Enterococcus sp. AZ163]|uniref:ArpU family phage packaging/lysis transcriptional regulator n=1 Tax=Enterococcus sp. AZ163 TaxID=2774638 RepID=UPI003D281CE9
MELLDSIDNKKAKQKAKRVLACYRRLKRIAGQHEINLRSPIISDMPRTPGSFNNKAEDATCIRVDAENELLAIEYALKNISAMGEKVLRLSYCDSDILTIFAISREIPCSERTVKNLKSEALMEFAEAYRNGKLMEESKVRK